MDEGGAPPPGGASAADRPVRRTRSWFVGRGIALLATAVSLYLVGPSLLEVFASWDQLDDLEPRWIGLVALAQLASFASLWGLQLAALRTTSSIAVITSQLAGNATARVVPGGAATGTAVQFHLLRTAGIDNEQAATGLTVAGLLQLATTFALPIIALPGVLLGAPVPPSFLNAAWVGVVLFVLLFFLVGGAMRSDRPLELAGVVIDVARRRIPGLEPPDQPTSRGLLTERDAVLHRLDGRWRRAASLAAGRAVFDYLSLLLAISAFGADPRPSLVLLAYASSALLGLIPLTPGGLGFVEAGLTGALAVAGVSPSDAVAATLLYRLFSFWLPIPIGLLAGVAHRLRFRS